MTLNEELDNIKRLKLDTEGRLLVARELKAAGAGKGARESIEYCEEILRILKNYETVADKFVSPSEPGVSEMSTGADSQSRLPLGNG